MPATLCIYICVKKSYVKYKLIQMRRDMNMPHQLNWLTDRESVKTNNQKEEC